MAHQPSDGEGVRHDEMVIVLVTFFWPGQQPDGRRRELRPSDRFPGRNAGEECHHAGPVLALDLVRRWHVGDVVPGSAELEHRQLPAELPCHELRGLCRPRQRSVLDRSEGHGRQALPQQLGLPDTPPGQSAVVTRLSVAREVQVSR